MAEVTKKPTHLLSSPWVLLAVPNSLQELLVPQCSLVEVFAVKVRVNSDLQFTFYEGGAACVSGVSPLDSNL